VRLIAELRRCPTCQRWAGSRRIGDDGHQVELDPAQPRGNCTEGPWHGSSRGPRNACGQWLKWECIAPPVTDDGSAPPQA